MYSLVVPEPPSQIADMETSISAALSISSSCLNYISGRTSTSGIAAELRPPCVCDLRTMEEVDSRWLKLTSLLAPGNPALWYRSQSRITGCRSTRTHSNSYSTPSRTLTNSYLLPTCTQTVLYPIPTLTQVTRVLTNLGKWNSPSFPGSPEGHSRKVFIASPHFVNVH